MQTSQAVSAGGWLTPGGIEAPSPQPATTTSEDAGTDFEQHLQQSNEVSAAPTTADPQTTATSEGGGAGPRLTTRITATAAAPHVAAPETVRSSGRIVMEEAGSEVVPTGAENSPPDQLLMAPESRPSPCAGDPEAAPANTRPDEQALAEAAAAGLIPVMLAPPPVNIEVRLVASSTTDPGEGSQTAAPHPASVNHAQEPARPDADLSEPESSKIEAPSAFTSPGGSQVINQASAETNARAGGSTRLQAILDSMTPVSSGSDTPETGQARSRSTALKMSAVEVASTSQVPVRPEAEGRPLGEPGSVASGRELGARGVEVETRRAIDAARLHAGTPESAAVQAAVFRRASLAPFTGTAAAKRERSMDNRLEQNQFAGSPEQKLPARGSNAPAAEFRPLTDRSLEPVREVSLDAAARRHGTLVDPAMARLASLAGSGMTANAPISGDTQAGAANRTAEQLLHNIGREVAQFKRFNAESMAVVLKPDGQTEIFLHLAARNGQIEIQARFERGDFAALSGQWTQLQQTLSQQGVRLGNLQEGSHPGAPTPTSGANTEWGHGQMNQGQQRPAQQDAGERSAGRVFDELAGAGFTKESKSSGERARPATRRTNAVLEAWA